MTPTRRDFLKNSALLALSLGPLSAVAQSARRAEQRNLKQVALKWIDEQGPRVSLGTTFGIPWPLGAVKESDAFVLRDDKQKIANLQSWPLAFWPDGSVKWSAFALSNAMDRAVGSLYLQKETEKIKRDAGIRVTEGQESFIIDNGSLRLEFAKKGSSVLHHIWIANKLVARDAHLKILLQDKPDTEGVSVIQQQEWLSIIEHTYIENQGSERLLLRVDGFHQDQEGQRKFPFILRFYIYKSQQTVKTMYTFLYDGDEQTDFIKGIGLSLSVPFHEQPTYNRYVRFVGDGAAVFAESVKGLTGLRRDPGEDIRSLQVQGKAFPLEAIDERVRRGLPYIPEFGDYSLSQLHASAFRIDKRTTEGHSWIHAVDGKRSNGTAYLGSAEGGVAFGIRNFWQSYPAQLDIRHAAREEGTLTAWLWAPRAPAMDLRFYHDGMGQDTYEKQWEGLEITYEDYEAGYATAHGVARSSELYLSFFSETPATATLADYAHAYQSPPLLTATPDYLSSVGVFGDNWSPPARQTATERALEDQLDKLFTFYREEVDRRAWYGFWNYGDVMHAYDEDRHVWRYDVGGFAWDNSELSTDLWLWYYYLRSGRADAFRMAEAMCRHTGEVDVYHLGKFAPLGSRHNVMHWGCSAKQLRISTAINRRFYYYLTADERTGDLLREQVEAVRKLEDVVALRKRINEPLHAPKGKMLVGFGTDWGAVAAAWFTEWERTRDPKILARLKESMRSIAKQPQGFFTGLSLFDPDTGSFEQQDHAKISVSHLNAVFGLVEIVQEILISIPDKTFEQSWLSYCRLYNASAEERLEKLGTAAGKFNLRSSHARLTAYAAAKLDDRQLAERAWQEFLADENVQTREVTSLTAENAWPAIQEWPAISTNWAAQWGLTAIQCLHFIGKYR
ncbi:exo-rhamnogalacturonan lyase family protein [Sphingobacterium bambusae]|uniref:Twin-arginine translocation signal domain-containing protein n=1 Tax=Sphingobacterium bambusae TaxID=662858 RepID=A0ABW6BCR5_9SPHI|nr:twin-arginine translocation signal domain-containing protein [Sphingobacterium bambusae]WPL49536.1 twin-arginine translocation signal domain-containing protein [Sphingobacterium bambusae]